MNGNWNYWGQKPTQFVALWRRVFNALRRDAPQTAMVWAPSSGNGYPYGRVTASAEDLILLDTNNDGVVNSRDDPYSPYYPGDEYVDWVGASVYFYGPTFPWQDNVEAPPGTFNRLLNDGNFYQQYAVVKNKPYMLAETAASFHTNTPTGPGVGDLAVKRAFWRQYITNATFLQTHPQLKMISLFEFFKAEEKLTNGEDDLRDFRVSNVTSIREAFLEDFAGVAKYYLTANYAKPGEVITTSPNGSVFPNLRTPVVVVDDKLPTGNNNQAIKTSSATTIGSFFSGILSLLFLV